MIRLTTEAQSRLDRYLRQVRASLQGCRSVDPYEVERDVMDHIDRELAGKVEPVPLSELEMVLERLGSPTQWVPEEELSWWRRTVLRLRVGPEDWRLAYISFGLLVFGFLLGSTAWLLTLAASFCVSRAAISVASDRGEQLAGQKWLIYPALVLVYLPLAFVVLLWPIFFAEQLLDELWRYFEKYRISLFGAPLDVSAGIMTVHLVTVAMAVWWLIAGLFLRRRPTLARMLFRPFADWFDQRWAKRLIFAGLGLTTISVVFEILTMNW